MKDLITAYKNFFTDLKHNVTVKINAFITSYQHDQVYQSYDDFGKKYEFSQYIYNKSAFNFLDSPLYKKLKLLQQNIDYLVTLSLDPMGWQKGDMLQKGGKLSMPLEMLETVCKDFNTVVADLKKKKIINETDISHDSLMSTAKDILEGFKRINLTNVIDSTSGDLLAGMFSHVATLKLEDFELTEEFVNQLLAAKTSAGEDYKPCNLSVISVSANEKVIQLLPRLLDPTAKLKVILDQGKFSVEGSVPKESKEQKQDLVNSLNIKVTEKTSDQIGQLLGVLPSGAAKHLTFTRGAFVKGIVLTDVDVTVLTISASCMLPTMVKDLSLTLAALSKLQSLCFDSVSFSTDDARAKFFQTILANESKDCSVFKLEKLEFSNCATFSPEEINMFLAYAGKNASLQSLKLNGVDWLPLKKDFDQICKFIGQDSKGEEIKTDSLPTKDELLARQKLLFSLHAKLTNLINIGFPEIKLIAGQPWLKSLQSIFAGWMKFLNQAQNFADVQCCLEKISELVKKFPGVTDTLDKHLLEICDKAVEKMVVGDEKAIVSQCKATGAIDVLLTKINLDGGKVLKKYICALRDTSILEMTELSLEHAKKHAPELIPSCLKACMETQLKKVLVATNHIWVLGELQKANGWLEQAKSMNNSELQQLCAESVAKMQVYYDDLSGRHLLSDMRALITVAPAVMIASRLDGVKKSLEQLKNSSNKVKHDCAKGFIEFQLHYLKLLDEYLEKMDAKSSDGVAAATKCFEQAKKTMDEMYAMAGENSNLWEYFDETNFKLIQHHYNLKLVAYFKFRICAIIDSVRLMYGHDAQKESNRVASFMKSIDKVVVTLGDLSSELFRFLPDFDDYKVKIWSWRKALMNQLSDEMKMLDEKEKVFTTLSQISDSVLSTANGSTDSAPNDDWLALESKSSYVKPDIVERTNSKNIVEEVGANSSLRINSSIQPSAPSSAEVNEVKMDEVKEAKTPTIVAPQKDNLVCPITTQTMIEPVIAADGQNYEKSAIQNWINRCKKGEATSPLTGLALAHLYLTPNVELKNRIAEHKAALSKSQAVAVVKNAQEVGGQAQNAARGNNLPIVPFQEEFKEDTRDKQKQSTSAAVLAMTCGNIPGAFIFSSQLPVLKTAEQERIDAQLLAISQESSVSLPLPVLSGGVVSASAQVTTKPLSTKVHQSEVQTEPRVTRLLQVL